MRKGNNLKMFIGLVLVIALTVSTFLVPLESVFAIDTSGAVDVTRGGYYDLPETVENYATSGKTLEFDLNKLIASTDVSKIALYDGTTAVSSDFFLRDGTDGLKMEVKALEDGWYHYTIPFNSVPHSETQENSKATRIRAKTSFPTGTKINNITVGVDASSLPEEFTDDYDEVTLADLGLAGTDYKTPVFSDTYNYAGKSKTKSVIFKFGWDANVTEGNDWKIALDTFWNANCMVWLLPNLIYFCPGQGDFHGLTVQADPVTSGRHDVEFGRLRVTAGPNNGKDFVFIKIDGEVRASQYTDYYQTDGGYVAYGDTKTVPSYTVCLVGDGVSNQRFSGFAKPDEYVADIDYVNISDIVPGGVVKDTQNMDYLDHFYPFTALSKTNSTVVKYVVKTGNLVGTYDSSAMVVDIGGNSGYCRSYIPMGEKENIMFGWEIEGCKTENWIKRYKFESNSWYAMEQGRLRVVSGKNAGKDFVYLKIDGDIVSSFYGEPDSKPFVANQIYVEATDNIQVIGYNEVSAKYYVDDEIYLEQPAQKGFNLKQPQNPKKDGNRFVGWYTEPTGGKLFDFKNTKAEGNINLYARFTADTVKATFNLGNGESPIIQTEGKNCLITPPDAPSYKKDGYDYIFDSWKNETTGQTFDFATGRIEEDTVFTAVYKEKEYFVSYYANGSLVKKVPFVLSNPTVSGKEPAVPEIPNATGVWESHETTGLTESITVNAVYNAKSPSPSTAINTQKYSGGKIYLNTNTVHDYLSTETPEKQTAFIEEYCSVGYEYKDYQNTSFKWTDSGKNSKYTVYFADNKDFKNAFTVNTEKTSLVNEVGIFTPGKTYYWYVCGNDTGKCSEVDSFKVVDTPVRYITAGKVTNMRDLGGYETEENNKVKYGLVYRGAALDEYHSHIDDEARKVFNYLGIKSEIELRGEVKHDSTGWDENNKNAFCINGHGYEPMLSLAENVRNEYKTVFEALSEEKNYPFYFHCSAGADRTGSFAYLLNGLLGVPYEDLRKDYELTSFSEVGIRPADTNANGSFDTMNRLMLEQYGDGSGNLQTAIKNYLVKFIGVSESALNSIKDIMLDKSPSPNEKTNKITVDVLGEKSTYQAFSGVYFMPEAPKAPGKIFIGFYNGNTKYNGYVTADTDLVAKFEDIKYEDYDTISLKDLGIKENKTENQINTVYTYKKTAKSGGRLFKFILEPIGNMQGGEGPQIALTNDFTKNSYARVWFQGNTMSHIYYSGVMDSLPDISKALTLEAGKQYDIEFSVRVMTNKGYEGKKIFEVTVNGELLVQYIGCKADLSENMIFFHGKTGAAYLINSPVYKTVNLYNGSTLIESYKVERSSLLPAVKEPTDKSGLRFAGWYTAKTGGKLFDENSEQIYNDMNLYARFADIRKVTATIDGKKVTYRVETGKTLSTLPKPQKTGNVFKGWAVNGKIFTGKVTKDMSVTPVFEKYSFDSYDEISLKDLGITRDLDFASFGDMHIKDYTYYKTAKTGGRVFKGIYVPTKDMFNGPQVSFSANWQENFCAKVYFTKYDELWVYSSGIVDGQPTLRVKTDLSGEKQHKFEIGVRVLNNDGYKGTKVFTVYLDGKLIFEELGNKMPLDGNTVFFQGAEKTGVFKNVDIVKTVKLYDGSKLLNTVKVTRGDLLPSMKEPTNKNGLRFAGWYTAKTGGKLFDENTSCIYKNISLYARFADVKKITATVNGKKTVYRVETGKTLASLPKPKKQGNVFKGWAVNGKIFTGKVTKDMTVTPVFEKYSFDSYDTISLKDLGIKGDLDFASLGDMHIKDYTYHKTAKTGGRVFKGIYVPAKDMFNGPQVSFSANWQENFCAKVYFTKFDELWVYSSGIVDGEPTLKLQTDLSGGKQHKFEIGVRVLNNSGYKGTKVFTVYLDGKLIFEQLGNKMPLEGNTVFFQGVEKTGVFKNVDIVKTVKLYDGKKLYKELKVTRGDLLPKVKEPANKNGLRFAGWYTAKTGGKLFDENTSRVYNSVTLYAHFADIKKVNVKIGNKTMLYRIKTGTALDGIPKPKKSGNIFKGWALNGKIFTGKVKKDITVTPVFEKYSFDSYDTISLKDLGIKGDLDFASFGSAHISDYTYHKTAKTGGRVFKGIYVPTKDMFNGPQVSFSAIWQENFCAKVYFTKFDELWVYSSGIVDGEPTLKIKTDLSGGKQYKFEIGVRVLNNKGYKGTKVFTVYLDGKLIFEELGNKMPLEGNTVFFQGAEKTGIFRNVNITKTVKLYDGNKLLKTLKVTRGDLLPKVKEPAAKNGLRFAGWYTAKNGGELFDENTNGIYDNMSLYAQFADVKKVTVKLSGKTMLYRIKTGDNLNSIPKPEKQGNVFMGWALNGKLFTGKVTSDMTVTPVFEKYSFDGYDTISLKDLGVKGNLDFASFGNLHIKDYTYYKTAKTGGRVFKAIYVPSKNMSNGPQVSFSANWEENFCAKLYFTRSDELWVYSSGIVDGMPTLKYRTDLSGGKQYKFEIGVRVLNNKGYKGTKVFTVYLDGKLIFEELGNKMPLEGNTVFLQGAEKTGTFRNVDIYNKVSFYDGDRFISSAMVLRGETVNSIGNLPDKGDMLFNGWYDEYGQEWNFDTDSVYMDTVLKANFSKRTYPVLLMIDGILYKRLNVLAGECIDVSDIPEKEGFEFDKWLCEDGSEYDILKPINAPVTLLASFKELTVTDTAEQIENNEPIENNKTDSKDLKYILFSIIGLAVVVTELGAIIVKKRSK